MKVLIALGSLLVSISASANIYLVSPKTIEVNNAHGTSCVAQQASQTADVPGPHVRIPVTIANPDRSPFVATSFRVTVFTKGNPQTCEVMGEELKAMGMNLPVPYGYQLTSSCDLTCGDMNVAVNKKLFATVEVIGHFVLADGTKKPAFQENSFEVLNFGTSNP
jgi:hypothetical protein